ncbi:patatin-like phospholipase family protein [Paraburkholderia sp. RL18-103-BIB-C]|jgi:NTE family protein|uniref:patatin-like phospholipase family protein n=1 Tax=unclassified Paraburkholderia TaxID=2615204 RepID=UPI0038BE0210
MGDNTHGERHTNRACRPDGAPDIPGQIVLVFQGGGALGAYQAGVYQALHDGKVEPHWVIGTSIGAINGAIIAGNKPENRIARLTQFWNGVACHGVEAASWLPGLANWLRDLATVTRGVPSFFTPRLESWAGIQAHVRPDLAAFYSTGPLRETLSSLVDFDYLNEKATRLTVGTVNVQSGRMRYFTNRDAPMGVEHVMASAAFPPGFPSVRLEGESYWDGGIYSNTPLEAVLDDRPRRDSVIFSVQLWPSSGPEPESILQVMSRQRDIQYSSRAESHLDRQKQIHRLRHVIRELGRYVPEEKRDDPEVQELLAWGCGTTMQVLELDAPAFDNDDLNRDIDFSSSGIKRRWLAGYEDTARLLKLAPWRETLDPMEGISVFRMAFREGQR